MNGQDHILSERMSRSSTPWGGSLAPTPQPSPMDICPQGFYPPQTMGNLMDPCGYDSYPMYGPTPYLCSMSSSGPSPMVSSVGYTGASPTVPMASSLSYSGASPYAYSMSYPVPTMPTLPDPYWVTYPKTNEALSPRPAAEYADQPDVTRSPALSDRSNEEDEYTPDTSPEPVDLTSPPSPRPPKRTGSPLGSDRPTKKVRMTEADGGSQLDPRARYTLQIGTSNKYRWNWTYGQCDMYLSTKRHAKEIGKVDEYDESVRKEGYDAVLKFIEKHKDRKTKVENGRAGTPDPSDGDRVEPRPFADANTKHTFSTEAFVRNLIEEVLMEHDPENSDTDTELAVTDKVLSRDHSPVEKASQAISSIETSINKNTPQVLPSAPLTPPPGTSATRGIYSHFGKKDRSNKGETCTDDLSLKEDSTPVMSSLQHRRSKRPPDRIPTLHRNPPSNTANNNRLIGEIMRGLRQKSKTDEVPDTCAEMTTRGATKLKHEPDASKEKSKKLEKCSRLDKWITKYWITLPSNPFQPSYSSETTAEVQAKLITHLRTSTMKTWDGAINNLEAVSDKPFSQWEDVTGLRQKIYDLFSKVPGTSIEVCRLKDTPKDEKAVKLMVLIPPADADEMESSPRTHKIVGAAFGTCSLLNEMGIDNLEVEVWEANFTLQVV